jgi:hypothetical protein
MAVGQCLTVFRNQPDCAIIWVVDVIGASNEACGIVPVDSQAIFAVCQVIARTAAAANRKECEGAKGLQLLADLSFPICWQWAVHGDFDGSVGGIRLHWFSRYLLRFHTYEALPSVTGDQMR